MGLEHRISRVDKIGRNYLVNFDGRYYVAFENVPVYKTIGRGENRVKTGEYSWMWAAVAANDIPMGRDEDGNLQEFSPDFLSDIHRVVSRDTPLEWKPDDAPYSRPRHNYNQGPQEIEQIIEKLNIHAFHSRSWETIAQPITAPFWWCMYTANYLKDCVRGRFTANDDAYVAIIGIPFAYPQIIAESVKELFCPSVGKNRVMCSLSKKPGSSGKVSDNTSNIIGLRFRDFLGAVATPAEFYGVDIVLPDNTFYVHYPLEDLFSRIIGPTSDSERTQPSPCEYYLQLEPELIEKIRVAHEDNRKAQEQQAEFLNAFWAADKKAILVRATTNFSDLTNIEASPTQRTI